MSWEWVWQLEEIDILIRDYGRRPVTEIAALLNRTVDSITSEARRLGLSSPARFRHQAEAQARNNRAVNVQFFEGDGPTVDHVLRFLRQWGRLYPAPRWLLRVRCPPSSEPDLLHVKRLLRSVHRVRKSERSLVLEIESRGLVESLHRRLCREGGLPRSTIIRGRLPSVPKNETDHGGH